MNGERRVEGSGASPFLLGNHEKTLPMGDNSSEKRTARSFRGLLTRGESAVDADFSVLVLESI
jgi:hypothetical protein